MLHDHALIFHYGTSLKKDTEGGRNLSEVYDTYNVINSHNFIRTRWFYSYAQDIVTNECICTICTWHIYIYIYICIYVYTKVYDMYDTCFIGILPFNFVRMPMHHYSRVHVGSNPVSLSADPVFKPRNGDRLSWFSSLFPV